MDPIPLDGARPRSTSGRPPGRPSPRRASARPGRWSSSSTPWRRPACRRTTRATSFIPCAPTREAAAFDVVVGASSIYGGSWMEGAGAVYAENQALRWISDLAGLPESAGGVLRAGRHGRNLSALVVARHTARARAKEAGTGARPYRIAATDNAHSSVVSMAAVMDAEVCGVHVDEKLRLTGPELRKTLEEHGPETFFAVVATSGTTNFGVVDDLASVAEVCREYGLCCTSTGPTAAPASPHPPSAPLPRHRARRLVHRRPAQVALRAVRLLRPSSTASRSWPGRAHAGGGLPRRHHEVGGVGTRPTTPSA